MKILVFTFTVVSFIQTSMAQIMLNRDDFPIVGKVYYEAVKWKGLAGLTHGEDGVGKFWDYSSLVSDDSDTSSFISSSSVSSIANFPGSNLAMKFPDGYEFYNYNNQFAAVTGLAKYGNGEYLLFNLDNLPFFKFPTSYTENNSFSNSRISQFKTKNNSTTSFLNSDSLIYKLTYTQSLEVKGWGNIKTPTQEGDVLKVKATGKILANLSHRNKITGVWAVSPTTQEFVTSKYLFYTKGSGLPLLSLTYTDSTDKNLSKVSWYVAQDILQSTISTAVASEQDYVISPNPGIHIFTFSSTKSSISRLTVVDVLGKEVPTSYDLQNGFFEVDAPNGIYSVNLYTDNGIVVKRILVQR